MAISIVPSLPASSEAELLTLLENLAGVAPAFQVDIVDGEFVPATPTWPYADATSTPEESLRALRPYAKKFKLELDCMVCNPSPLFSTCREIGILRVVIHFGSSTDMAAEIAAAHEAGLEASLGIRNSDELDHYKNLLEQVDGVQVMGIASIGKQGQPFDERTLSTIDLLKQAHPTLPIAVDGSVNTGTIPQLVEAGATRLCPGSAIAKSSDPRLAYQELYEQANRIVL